MTKPALPRGRIVNSAVPEKRRSVLRRAQGEEEEKKEVLIYAEIVRSTKIVAERTPQSFHTPNRRHNRTRDCIFQLFQSFLWLVTSLVGWPHNSCLLTLYLLGELSLFEWRQEVLNLLIGSENSHWFAIGFEEWNLMQYISLCALIFWIKPTAQEESLDFVHAVKNLHSSVIEPLGQLIWILDITDFVSRCQNLWYIHLHQVHLSFQSVYNSIDNWRDSRRHHTRKESKGTFLLEET